jgi:hypothetical protein
MNIYTIYDKTAKKCSQPMFMVNSSVALRAVKANMMRDDDPFKLFPEQYDLVFVGSFNEDTGQITPNEIILEPEDPDMKSEFIIPLTEVEIPKA